MSKLRRAMIDALELRGRSDKTLESYVWWVVQLSRHYRKSPDLLSDEECQQYLLHLIRDRKLARSTVNQASCALRFFFSVVVGRESARFTIPMARVPQKLPEILSRQEVARLLSCARQPTMYALLVCAYGLGLRASELCGLRP